MALGAPARGTGSAGRPAQWRGLVSAPCSRREPPGQPWRTRLPSRQPAPWRAPSLGRRAVETLRARPDRSSPCSSAPSCACCSNDRGFPERLSSARSTASAACRRPAHRRRGRRPSPAGRKALRPPPGPVFRSLGNLAPPRPMAQPMRGVSDSPPGLVPPAVQRAQVQRAVGRRFHAAGSARLHGPPGRVQPHIHALNEVTGDAHIVVLQEDQPPAKLLAARQRDDLPDQFLAGVVTGVRLSRQK